MSEDAVKYNADKIFNENVDPFDPILAEDYQLRCYEQFGDACPHDFGIQMAQMAEAFWKEYK